MADKSFGVKELNLLGSSGTPSIDSPNDLNLNANTVAISTNLTVGSKLSVTSAGILTAVSGVVTYYGVFNGDGSNLTGLAATDKIVADSLVVSGISTLGDFKFEAGIVTAKAGAAITYYGDGQYLSGTSADIPGINTTGTSVFNILDIDGNIDVDGNAGIGSLNVTGIATFKDYVGFDTGVTIDGISTVSGLKIGDWVNDTAYKGIYHQDQTTTEYLIISNDSNTLVSASSGGSVILRANSNSTEHQLEVTTSGVTVGGVGVLTSNSDITVKDITADNISIGGTLTYEDVTNVDSIGIVTAGGGIRIGLGGTVGPSASGVVTYYGDGQYLDNIFTTGPEGQGGATIDAGVFVGTGLSISGVSTFSDLTANRVVTVGAGGSLVDNSLLGFDGVALTVTGNLFLPNTGNHMGIGTASKLGPGTDALSVWESSEDSGVRIWASSALHHKTSVPLQVADYQGTEYFRVNGDGNIGIGTTFPTASNITNALQSNSSVLAVGVITANTLYVNGSAVTGGGASWAPDADENLYAGTDAGKCSGSQIANCFNVAIGYSAGYSIGDGATNGFENVLIGKCAGTKTSVGVYNVFLGSLSGCNNSSGGYNVAIGDMALEYQSSGNSNVAVGSKAGKLTTGYCNTFLGAYAGNTNTSGCCNIAIGRDVELPSATANNQMAIGSGNCHWITGNADFNVGIGTTNPNAEVGTGNTAKLSVGIVSAVQFYGSGEFLTGITSEGMAGVWTDDTKGNLKAGTESGQSLNGFGCCNILIGRAAGRDVTSGDCNILVGVGAGSSICTGDGNIILGDWAGPNIKTGGYNFLVGYRTGYCIGNDGYNIMLGHCAGYCSASGSGNVFLGRSAGYGATMGSTNVYVGCDVGCGQLFGLTNVAIGYKALKGNSMPASHPFGLGSKYSIALGKEAGANDVSGEHNIYMGCLAGGLADVTGSQNLNNIHIGCNSGCHLKGDCNVFLGVLAGGCTGKEVSLVGTYPDDRIVGNTYLGASAGVGNTNGHNNVFIGSCAGATQITGSCNVVIGHNVGLADTTASNQLAIGSSSTTWLTGTSTGSVSFPENLWADKKLFVNQTSSVGNGKLQVSVTGHSGDAFGQAVDIFQYSSTAGCGAQLLFNRSKNATLGSNTDVADGDSLGRIVFRGYNDNFWNPGAEIEVVVDGTPSSGTDTSDMPGAILLKTTPDGSATPSERFRVGPAGQWGIGGATYGTPGQVLKSGGDSAAPSWGNVASGPDAQENVYLGTNAGTNSDTDTCYNIGIGYSAAYSLNSGNNNVILGKQAGACLTSGQYNIFLGCHTGYNSNGTCNFFAVNGAGCHNDTGINNVFIGSGAGAGTGAATKDSNGNIALGQAAGFCLDSGDYNVFIGNQSGGCTTHNGCNIYVGWCAGKANRTGYKNIVMGCEAASGSFSIVRDGSDNVILGSQAGCMLDTGDHNVFLGACAGIAITSGGYNIGLGYSAGASLWGGSGNILLGNQAGKNLTTGNCNIAIGRGTTFPSATGDCQLVIGQCLGNWITGDSSYNVTLAGIATVYSATGVVSATAYYGDGSHLLGTGGDTLISGITIQEGGTNVGTGGSITTINFVGGGVSGAAVGDHGVALTITGERNLWVSNDTGIHTTANVGIGTTTVLNSLLTLSAPPGSNNDLIVMSAAGAASTERITIGSTTLDNGTISFEGSEGTLLSITNNLSSGSIFSVNDISGIPSIDVDADGTILLSPLSSSTIGYVGIGTDAPSTRLHVEGNVKVTGVVTATDFDSTSDIRLKTNIKPIDDPLAKVVQIEGVSFNWKKDNRPALGVIADQIEKVIPELVHGDDPKTVNYNGLVGLLIEVVKDQQTQIDDLNKRLSKLE